MSISAKEAALRAIEQLPDDASTEDVLYTIYVRFQIERGLRDLEAGNTVSHEDVKREIDTWLKSVGADVAAASDTHASPLPGEAESDGDSDVENVTYHLEREGHITVLVPDRPVPPLDADVVTRLLDEMYREREKRWLNPSGEGD